MILSLPGRLLSPPVQSMTLCSIERCQQVQPLANMRGTIPIPLQTICKIEDAVGCSLGRYSSEMWHGSNLIHISSLDHRRVTGRP